MSFQAKFAKPGASVNYTPSSAVAAGEIVIQGDLIGVAKNIIPADTLGALAITGEFDVAKASGTGVTFAVGAKVIWDDDADTAVASGGTKLFGICTVAAANADSTVRAVMVQADPVLSVPAGTAVDDAAAITAADPDAITAADPDAITAADPDAMTAAAAALTAADPDAMTASAPDACAEMTASLTNVDTGTDMTAAQAATIVADLAALKAGIDANNAAIDALIADVTSIHAQEVAGIADGVTQKAVLDALIADVTSIRDNVVLALDDATSIRDNVVLANDDVTSIRDNVVLALDDVGSIRTQLNALLASLRAASLLASA